MLKPGHGRRHWFTRCLAAGDCLRDPILLALGLACLATVGGHGGLQLSVLVGPVIALLFCQLCGSLLTEQVPSVDGNTRLDCHSDSLPPTLGLLEVQPSRSFVLCSACLQACLRTQPVRFRRHSHVRESSQPRTITRRRAPGYPGTGDNGVVSI